MERSLFDRMAISCAAFMVVWIIAAIPAAMADSASEATLTVSGRGHAEAAPDQVEVQFGMTRSRPKATEALKESRDIIADLVRIFMAAGIGRDQISTGHYSLTPIYADSDRRDDRNIVGYRTETELQLRLYELDRLGAVIDDAIAAGVNRIGAIRFLVETETQDRLAALARRRAVAEARRRAQDFAAASGLRLGPVMSIRQGENINPSPRAFRAMHEGGVPSPVLAGAYRVSEAVTMIYRLLDD